MRDSMKVVKVFLAVLALGALSARAQEKPAPEPPKIEPVSEQDKAKLLAAETPEQKALRAELADMGKAGQRIYFNANCDGVSRIYVMNPDGSAVKCLTPDAGGNYPHCSPDGRQIVFCSGRVKLERGKVADALKDVPVDPKYPLDIRVQKWQRYKTGVVWIMNADGSDPKPLAFGSLPHWSRDGKYVAYSIVSPPWPNQLAIMDMTQKVEHCIESPKFRNCGMPAWSPDDNYIVGANGAAYVIKLNADKSAAESAFAINNGHPCNGEVSPDGKAWIYVIDTNGNAGSWLCWQPLDYEKPVRGGGQLPLQHAKGSVNYFPDFSPDGKYFVYVHADPQPGVKSWELKDKQEIYVSTFPDCKVTVRLTFNGAANQHPQWWAPAKAAAPAPKEAATH